MTSVALADLQEGKPKRIEVNGKPVCLARIGDEVFAVTDTCSHSEAALSEGDITGFTIECWLHGAEFDLRTGAALTPPATAPLETYQVTREGESIIVTEQ